MEGFKSLPKIQCFKEGGSVQREVKNFTKRDRKTVDEADTALDKKIVKKAIGMHDKQEHPGEKTDLSKLRKGGRAKKDCGTVKKYKAGGNVTNVYEAKKKSGDKDAIRAVKQITPTKAAAVSAPVAEPVNTAVKYKAGGNVAEMGKKAGDKDATVRVKATGNKKADAEMFKNGDKIKKFGPGGSALMGAKLNAMEQQRSLEKMARAKKYLTGDQQGQLVGQSPAAAGLQQFGAQATQPEMRSMAPAMAPAAVNPMGDVTGMPMQKRGGKVKKAR